MLHYIFFPLSHSTFDQWSTFTLLSKIYSYSSWRKAYCYLEFWFFCSLSDLSSKLWHSLSLSLSLVSLWSFSSELWPTEQSRKKGKWRCGASLDDQKPTICAKVEVKFYDNLKIKGVKSGGLSVGGASGWVARAAWSEGPGKVELSSRSSVCAVEIALLRWVQGATPAVTPTWELWGLGTEAHPQRPRT